MLFFVYYFLTSRRGPMYLITILNDLAAPLAFGFLGALIMGRQEGVWIGIAVAPVFTLLVCALVILFVYGKKSFPYLMPFRNEERIFFYSFPLSSENTAAMAETAGSLLTEENYPRKTGKFVELVLEEVLMLIREKNPEAEKKLIAECSLILEDDGVRLILRDSGGVFDLTDSEADIQSFRQYIVTRVMTNFPKRRMYIASAGYNRCEFFFEREAEGDVKR